MQFVTLDTGFKGAMVLFEGTRPLDALTFYKIGNGINISEVSQTLEKWKPERVFIEIFPPQPYQGVKATSSQWKVIGQLDAICQLQTEVEYIYVSTWTSFTKRLSLNPLQKNKQISQELTHAYFSQFSEPYKKRKLYHDGIADCLCLSLYVNRDHYVDDIISI